MSRRGRKREAKGVVYAEIERTLRLCGTVIGVATAVALLLDPAKPQVRATMGLCVNAVSTNCKGHAECTWKKQYT